MTLPEKRPAPVRLESEEEEKLFRPNTSSKVFPWESMDEQEKTSLLRKLSAIAIVIVELDIRATKDLCTLVPVLLGNVLRTSSIRSLLISVSNLTPTDSSEEQAFRFFKKCLLSLVSRAKMFEDLKLIWSMLTSIWPVYRDRFAQLFLNTFFALDLDNDETKKCLEDYDFMERLVGKCKDSFDSGGSQETTSSQQSDTAAWIDADSNAKQAMLKLMVNIYNFVLATSSLKDPQQALLQNLQNLEGLSSSKIDQIKKVCSENPDLVWYKLAYKIISIFPLFHADLAQIQIDAALLWNFCNGILLEKIYFTKALLAHFLKHELGTETVEKALKDSALFQHILSGMIYSNDELEKDSLDKLFETMETEFLDENGVLETITAWILNCNKKTNFFDKLGREIIYYAAYFVLCQRSGAGKTRLLYELGKQKFVLFYIGMSGYFKSSSVIVEFLKNLESSTDEASRRSQVLRTGLFYQNLAWYILAIIKELFPDCYENPEDLDDTQMEKLRHTVVTRFWPKSGNEEQSMQEEEWMKIIKGEYRGNADPYSLLSIFGIKKFVLAIDEARGLLHETPSNDKFSPFRNIRKALSVIGGDWPLCVLLADTQSRVANFLPTNLSEPSERYDPDGELFPPFNYVANLDLNGEQYLLNGYEHLKSNKAREFLDERDKEAVVFCDLGSPLWNAFLQYTDTTEQSSGLRAVAFAASKLCGGKDCPEEDYQNFAALACRIVPQILPSLKDATELVAKSMAILHYISLDRAVSFTGYQSDPVLAAGGAHIFRNNGSSPLSALRFLSSQIQNATIGIGESAEVVTQIILLAAFDATKTNISEPLQSSDCIQFLDKLFGGKVTFPEKSKLVGSKVFFNHFQRVNKKIVWTDVQNAFLRGAVLMGNINQKAVDFIIPIVLANGRLSCILIQVKNLKESLRNINGSWNAAAMEYVSSMSSLFESLTGGSKRTARTDTPLILFLVNYQQSESSLPAVESVVRRADLTIFAEGFSKELFPSLWNTADEGYTLLENLLQNRTIFEPKMRAESKKETVVLSQNEFAERSVEESIKKLQQRN